jgi:Family of unknown function (DUF5681)
VHDDTLRGVSDLKAENKFMANKIETMPDQTGEKQIATRFKPGQSGNPAGRPKGARSRLGEKFLDDLYDRWEEHGKKALEICALREPATFIKVVANVLPRELLVKALNVNATMDFADVEDARAFLKAYRFVRDAQPEPLELEHAEDGALLAEWRSADD